MSRILRIISIAVVAAVVLSFAAPGALAGRDDSEDWRRKQMLPDDYLDPSWPIGDSPIDPEQSDSVENVPIDDEQLDAAEREEIERYKEQLGLVVAPDELTEDHIDEPAGDGAPGSDNEGYDDPVEW